VLAKEKEKELRAKEKAAEEKRKKGAVYPRRQLYMRLMRYRQRKQNCSNPFRLLRKSLSESVCGYASSPVNNCLFTIFPSDPKTVLCVYFKAGHCDKGNKCKFSHDMNIGRKVEKKDLYSDTREEKENGKDYSFLFLAKSLASHLTHCINAVDTMDKWDEEKLRSVVTSKAGNPRTTTDIVCKYFIEAIETERFGWFWECPNGASPSQSAQAHP
jgi:Zinc finger C-x8-C-x5-C-x3-H type (and similar)